ncbi:hypothetical protein GCM10009422_11970 [Brevundimonas kwangchunensis]|uniref:Uncharacterized protein n=1 Tax=Brevundimonas kwangchunensis TaxID=322163 RepID=A0ABP3RZ99_9CAUL
MKAAWEGKDKLCKLFLKEKTVQIVESSLIVEEKDPGGAGSIKIQISGDALQFGPSETAVKWLASNECADGAFLEFSENGLSLHIIELKSKLDTKKWEKAKSQFRGMFLRATAICSVLGIGELKNVTCYIAYCEDAITPHLKSNPILLKRTLGDGGLTSKYDDWTKRTVNITDAVVANVVDVVRDNAGNSTLDLAA